MEAGEYRLARGTYFVECRSEFHEVAGLLRISLCVLGGADLCFFFNLDLIFLRTNAACFTYEATSGLLTLFASKRQGRGSEATEAVFYPGIYGSGRV